MKVQNGQRLLSFLLLGAWMVLLVARFHTHDEHRHPQEAGISVSHEINHCILCDACQESFDVIFTVSPVIADAPAGLGCKAVAPEENAIFAGWQLHVSRAPPVKA